jgi:hypothetical protein
MEVSRCSYNWWTLWVCVGWGQCVLDHDSVVHDYTAICGLREALGDLSSLLLGCGLLLSATTTSSGSISITVSLWKSGGEGEEGG